MSFIRCSNCKKEFFCPGDCSEIYEFQDKIRYLNREIDKLESQLYDARQTITGQEETICNKQEDISLLNEEIDRLKNKLNELTEVPDLKFPLVKDSYKETI